MTKPIPFEALSNTQKAELDGYLFADLKIVFLRKLVDYTGQPLKYGIEFIHERFNFLVANHKDKFQVPLDDYWEDFYT